MDKKVHELLNQQINKEFYSAYLYLDFSNYFKRTFKISPKQYILNKRILEIQRLLIESRMNVKEIAAAVGFENENYFSEYFAKKVGISALKFRRRQIPTERESIF